MNIVEPRSHAYILSAPAEAGYAAACALAKAILCASPKGGAPCGLCENCRKVEKGVHPDIITVSRRLDEKGRPKREIYVEQIRELISDSAVLPNEADKKVYIIRDAGAMNAAAQNALLKVLEEPPYFVVFVLVVDNAGSLLETVRSRCVIHYLSAPEDVPQDQVRARAQEYLSDIAAGDRLSLLRFANGAGELTNAELQDFVRGTRLLLSDLLCGRQSSPGLSRAKLLELCGLMDTAERYLRANVGGKQVLGLLSTAPVLP